MTEVLLHEGQSPEAISEEVGSSAGLLRCARNDLKGEACNDRNGELRMIQGCLCEEREPRSNLGGGGGNYQVASLRSQ